MLGWNPRRSISWVLLASLSIAFAGFTVIAILSQYERHFNRALDPSKTVYQIYTQIVRPGQETTAMAASLPDLAAAIKASVPTVNVARITLSQEPRTITVADKPSLVKIDEADPSLADVIRLTDDHELARSTLTAPDGALIIRSAARRLFPGKEAIGQTFEFDEHTYRIGATIDDLPRNSSLAGSDILISSTGAWTTLGAAGQAGAPMMLTIGDAATFVQIPAGSDALLTAVQRSADRQAEILRRRLLAGQATEASAVVSFAHKAVPIRSPEQSVAVGSAPDPQQLDPAKLRMLLILALTVLIAASLNASSLTMSQLLVAAPVVAVRRAFGASRNQVMRSALTSGVVVFAIAAAAGWALAAVLADPFGSALGRPVDRFPDLPALALIAGLAGTIGIASTAYPAFAASRFQPSAVLSSRWANIPGASIIRAVLVALQVGSSAAIIVFAAIVYQQLSFLTRADLGFTNAQAVAFKLPEPIAPDDPRAASIRGLNRADGDPVSLTAILPSEGRLGQIMLGDGTSIEASSASIDPGYFAALGARPLAGRAFTSSDMTARAPGATRPVILSANLAAALGLSSPRAAIGQIIRVPNKLDTLHIVAVVPDLPAGTIRADRRPYIVYEAGSRPAAFVLAGSSDIEAKLSQMFPSQPLEKIALGERIRSAYLDLGRIRWLSGLFAMLALATASVGIYALAVSRAAAMRVEAGVRKAFGAEGWSIVLLLAERLLPSVAAGTVIGLTLGSVAAAQWLSTFTRQAASVPLACMVSILAIVFVFIMASAGQALTLARSKPVETLRE